jgi:hypothetical protein
VNQAVIALKGNKYTHATSVSALKGAKLGTQLGTTSYDFIQDVIKPSPAAGAYHTMNDAINALKAHQIDGIVADLPTAFYMTAVQIPNSTIVGQFPASQGGDHFGLVLAKGSPLTSCVDKALERAQEQRHARPDPDDLALRQGERARPSLVTAPDPGRRSRILQGGFSPMANVSIALVSTVVFLAVVAALIVNAPGWEQVKQSFFNAAEARDAFPLVARRVSC